MNAQRDAHLLAPDFFDVAQYPTMVFESDTVEVLTSHSFMVRGHLSLHGQTHPYEFRLDVTQPVRGLYGEMRIGADMEGYLRRSTWGLKWNQTLELGGLALSDDVNVRVNIQVTPQSDPNLHQHWELEDNGQSIDFTVRHHRLLRGQLSDVRGWLDMVDGRPQGLQVEVGRCTIEGVSDTLLAGLFGSRTPLAFTSERLTALGDGDYEVNGSGRIGSLSVPLTARLSSVRLPQAGRTYIGARVQIDVPASVLTRLRPGTSAASDLRCSLWFSLPAVMTETSQRAQPVLV